ncbi:MAG: YggS family pyridoxal phosphate-dependent enzyme [Akkermansiaceae bacterium]|nr:YggS family pyridoxal phosphate-dependent enzyme [Armatimonadota bacterium]
MTDMFDVTEQRAREISDNIRRVREQIAVAAERAGQQENAITLCAVTKTRPVSDCLAAVSAGVSNLGENYVQEAREKIPAIRAALPDRSPITCHLIGHLQTNKIKHAVHFTNVFQTVDSEECLQGIAKSIQKLYNGATTDQASFQTARVLIEVNLAGSESRAGIAPESAIEFALKAREIPGILLSGFMGMAPYVEKADEARPYFARLKKFFDALPTENRQILSMGMSGDFQAAIQEGATLVRIGTAIFGRRE